MKKTILLLLLSWAATHSLFSQNSSFCGSVATPTPKKDHDALVELFKADMPEGNLPPKVIPIKVHIIREDDGSGGMSPDLVIPGIDTLNAFFAQTNLQFSLCGGPNFIDNSDFYVVANDPVSQGYGPALSEMAQNNEPDVVNIFVVDSFSSPPPSIFAGWASFPWNQSQYIAIRHDFFDTFTLAHEMGHFLGLYHPHEDALGDGKEYVNGSNCSSAGDFLCDTPADPNLLYYTDDNCQYVGTLTDPLGDAYQPDVENIMSYSGCAETLFSPQQTRRMNYYLLTYMSEFSCDGSSLGDTAYLMLYTAIEPSPSIMSCGVPQAVQASITNFGQAGITANFGAALLDTDGDFLAWIDTLSGPATLNSGFYFPSLYFTLSNPGFPPGDYQIGIFYRKDGTANWLPIEEGGYDNTLPIEMTCGIPCQAPSAPELAAFGYSHIQVQWPELPSVTEYQTRQRKVGATAWVNGNWNTEPTTHWDNLTPCTDYEIQVQARCGIQTTGFSPSLLFTTEGCGDPYCYSYGSSWDDWIQKVEFGGFKHTSGNDYGYSNFTALKAQVELGSSYPIKLTAGTNEDPKTVYWRIWIDFNQDGDFTEFNEMVLQLSGSNSSPFTANINIPAGIITGTTRMRISMATFAFPFPCNQAFGEREVEDYSIEILPIPEISANPTQLNFQAAGGFAGVDVSANIAWNASTAASWLSIGNGAGTGSGSFSVTCSENTEIAPRSATIILSGNGLEVEITVEQEGAAPFLEASLLQLGFDPTGLPSQEITIDANVPWEATCAAAWVTIVNGAGSGAGAFSVTCAENLDLAPRTATIILSGNGLEVEITVEQEGAAPYLEASLLQLDFDQSGQPEQAVIVNGNVAWEASASANWINISSGNGTGDGAFQVSCAENLNLDPRTGNVILSGNGLEVTITVTQEGNPSSTAEFKDGDWLHCFPNPTSGQVTWTGLFPNCQEATLVLFNEEGKLLLHQTYGMETGKAWQFEASLQDFPSGVYYYQVTACGQAAVGEVFRR